MDRKTLLGAAAGLLCGFGLVLHVANAPELADASAPFGFVPAAAAPEKVQADNARNLWIVTRVVMHLEQQLQLATADFAALGPGYSAEHKRAGRLILQFGAELNAARAYALELGAEFQTIRNEPDGGGWAARRVP